MGVSTLIFLILITCKPMHIEAKHPSPTNSLRFLPFANECLFFSGSYLAMAWFENTELLHERKDARLLTDRGKRRVLCLKIFKKRQRTRSNWKHLLYPYLISKFWNLLRLHQSIYSTSLELREKKKKQRVKEINDANIHRLRIKK